MRQRKPITSFTGEYFFLSNFSPCKFSFRGKRWYTVEHAYQAMKTINPKEREKIYAAFTPRRARQVGRHVTLRADWNSIKYQVMKKILIAKFEQNPNLIRALRHTGDAYLAESNRWHDNYWGDCRCGRCINISGKNYLGKLLMQIRKEL